MSRGAHCRTRWRDDVDGDGLLYLIRSDVSRAVLKDIHSIFRDDAFMDFSTKATDDKT
jgi:hypothetical protein